MSRLGGGDFGSGFLSAGVTQSLSGKIDSVSGAANRIMVAAVIGGTVSAATGGKFANGALTAAFSRAFNAEYHDGDDKYYGRIKAKQPMWSLGDDFEAVLDDYPYKEMSDYEMHIYRKGKDVGAFKHGEFFDKHGNKGIPDRFKNANLKKLLAIDTNYRIKKGIISSSSAKAAAATAKYAKSLRIFKNLAFVLGPALGAYSIYRGESTISNEAVNVFVDSPLIFSGDVGIGSEGPYAGSYLRTME